MERAGPALGPFNALAYYFQGSPVSADEQMILSPGTFTPMDLASIAIHNIMYLKYPFHSLEVPQIKAETASQLVDNISRNKVVSQTVGAVSSIHNSFGTSTRRTREASGFPVQCTILRESPLASQASALQSRT
jgi:hypothetical protein